MIILQVAHLLSRPYRSISLLIVCISRATEKKTAKIVFMLFEHYNDYGKVAAMQASKVGRDTWR